MQCCVHNKTKECVIIDGEKSTKPTKIEEEDMWTEERTKEGGVYQYPAAEGVYHAAQKNLASLVKHLLTDEDQNVNFQNKWGDTALIFGVTHGNIQVVKMLLAAKADFNHQGFIHEAHSY